jgi:hypothetical protein
MLKIIYNSDDIEEIMEIKKNIQFQVNNPISIQEVKVYTYKDDQYLQFLLINMTGFFFIFLILKKKKKVKKIK